MKFDLLGLKNISELYEQFHMVKEVYGEKITFNNIPLDDKKTWDLIGSGNTLGVFQFASNLAISVVTKIKPRNIEELSAANSFIRPGASGLDEYVAAKKDLSKIRKLHPELDEILATTYGAIVYQEQIMGLIAHVMNIDFGEADVYRRWLEKPNKFAEKIAKWKEDFIQCGLNKGYGEKLTNLLAHLIIENCGYGFNKSHAVSYSIIGYWTAYMKANFPLVFYTTMLNGNLDDADLFLAEARKVGIKILPPHVNHSKLMFTVEGNENIRAGFNAIKGVGPKAVDAIIETQPYTSIDDYFAKNNKSAVNKGVVSALIKAGAFSDLDLEIEKSDIPVELHDKFIININHEEKSFVKLNREQMNKWYELLNEVNSKKATPNYVVPLTLIKGKYFDQFQLIEEKNENVVVVPGDKLSDLGLKIEDLPDQSTTRKHPKGSFDKSLDPLKSIPPFRKPIILHHRELSTIQVSDMDMYLKEVEEFGFSFLPHPLEKDMNKINLFDEIEDGQIMTTAGIITNIVQRPTKTGKVMYWVTIKSPRDSVRITLWSNQYETYKNYIKKNGIIIVRGTKGFGGMGIDTLRPYNPKK